MSPQNALQFDQKLQEIWRLLNVDATNTDRSEIRSAIDTITSQLSYLEQLNDQSALGSLITWLVDAAADSTPRSLLDHFCQRLELEVLKHTVQSGRPSYDLEIEPRNIAAVSRSAAISTTTSARISFVSGTTSNPTSARTSFTSATTSGPAGTPSSDYGSSAPWMSPDIRSSDHLANRHDATLAEQSAAGAERDESSSSLKRAARVFDTSTCARDNVTQERRSKKQKHKDSKTPTATGTRGVPHQITSMPSSGFGDFDKALNPQGSRKRIETAFAKLCADGKLPAHANVLSTPQGYVAAAHDPKLMLKADITLSQSHSNLLLQSSFQISRMTHSTSLERRFGWHRLMTATIQLAPLSSHTRGYKPAFERAFKAWLQQPKEILGRTWRAFYLEDSDRKSDASPADSDSKSPTRVVDVSFFALEGYGIPSMSLLDFTAETLHLRHNLKQPCLKLYARWKLLLSRTRSALTFEHHEISIFPDPSPSIQTERDPYRDPSLDVSTAKLRSFLDGEAMTDGNFVLSVGAAIMICEMLGLTYRPTLFQARFFGAKGVWYISAPYDTEDSYHLGRWIKVHDSQVKVNLDPGAISEADLSFDIVATSSPPKSIYLRRDFLPILVERGVPIAVLKELARQGIEDTSDRWYKAFTDPRELALLLHARLSVFEYPGRRGLATTDSLVQRQLRELQCWLDNGYVARDWRYLSEILLRLYGLSLADDLTKFRIKCPQATSLVGIAVDSDELQPHEIFFCFSTRFEDPRSGEAVSFLPTGTPVLVARDPTLRSSDIQKFTYAFKPALAHLKDVLVFSSRGRMPSAAKLQGGDYDGDRYVIIWEPSVTSHFKNAPVQELATLKELGIERQTTRLEELIHEDIDEAFCDRWYTMAFDFSLHEKLLGQVTNYLYDLSYHYGLNGADLKTRTAVKHIADVHDWIIDATKSGYIFTYESFNNLKAHLDLPIRLQRQSWKLSLDALQERLQGAHSSNALSKNHMIRDFCANFSSSSTHHSVLDDLWFTVMLRTAAEAMARILNALPAPAKAEGIFLLPYQSLVNLRPDIAQDTAALDGLKKAIRPIFKEYKSLSAQAENYRNGKLDALSKVLEAIGPPKGWELLGLKTTELGLSQWDLVKASIVVMVHNESILGGNAPLCKLIPKPLRQIKAESELGRARIAEVKSMTRPKRRPQVVSSESTLSPSQHRSQAEQEALELEAMDFEAGLQSRDLQEEPNEWDITSSVLADELSIA